MGVGDPDEWREPHEARGEPGAVGYDVGEFLAARLRATLSHGEKIMRHRRGMPVTLVHAAVPRVR
jgi:hypothetical protein